MGYRSDVAIAVAFNTREQMEEVLAVYRIDPRVQKHNVMKEWKLCPDHEPPYMVYAQNAVKWYDSYEDVKAFEHIINVCESFAAVRGFEYLYRLVRIGEEQSDIDVAEGGNDPGYYMSDFLNDRLHPVRHIECTL